jgi:hypothetical protein
MKQVASDGQHFPQAEQSKLDKKYQASSNALLLLVSSFNPAQEHKHTRAHFR